MSETGAQVNGPSGSKGKFIDGINPDDPNYIKNLQRPAEVKEDLQQMENRSRVKMVLSSEAFRDELEQIVQEHLQCGPYPETLMALKQITDLLVPQARGTFGNLGRAGTVIPINDIRGTESAGFSKGEKLLRCKLAALYRLVDLCGWSHGVYNHISARVSSDDEHFLLNPFGMLYSEVTASSLIKVDVNGSVIEQGSSQLGVNKAGFTLHSAIHQSRPDIKCVVHLHTPAAVAVSAMKCGLLPMSQEALICGNVSYHDYRGIFIDADEREQLARSLGVHNKVLFLRNHGVVACGETIEETFHFTFNLMAACEAQVRAIPAGIDNIILPSEEARQQVFQTTKQGGGGVETSGKKWKVGELEFEALMRTLDNSGYRTGYLYRMPTVKQEKKERSNSEVEIPPTSSSFSYMFDGDETSKYSSPLKAAMERQKKAYKAGWLTSPNAYKKTEVEEIGTTTPKKITKWVSEGESTNRPGSTPLKIDSPNQFAPQGENPKEFKEKQKRTSALALLCLAVFLPCILCERKCRCKFPPYLSGLINEPTNTRDYTTKWFMSFPDNMYKRTSSPEIGINALFDFKTLTVYYTLVPEGRCLTHSPLRGDHNETVPRFVPKNCIPADAKLAFALPIVGAVFIHQEGDFNYAYLVRPESLKSETCTPRTISIYKVREDNSVQTYFHMTKIIKDSRQEPAFYKEGLTTCHGIDDIEIQ